MPLLGFFRRQPPIAHAATLAAFIDEQAAYVIQKGIYDYAQARAGPYTKLLAKDPAFLDAVERSRWEAYPLGLAMLGELADGVLRPGLTNERAMLDRLIALVLGIFDRYPPPPQLGDTRWAELRDELARKLAQVGMHPPKRAIDIPEIYAQRYFDLMPFHKNWLTRDQPTARAYLRITLANIHSELVRRIDPAAVVESLQVGETAPAPSPP